MPRDESNYYAEHEGEPHEAEPWRTTSPPASGVAIASLVCGALLCVPMIPSLLAVIFGFIGIRKTRDPRVGGRGLSIAGLVLGAIGVGVWLVLGAIVVAVVQSYATDLGEIQSVSNQFVQALSDGKIDAAAALADPDLDRKELVEASTAMKAWGPFNEVLGHPVLFPVGAKIRGEIDGRAIFNRADRPISLHLVKMGTTYRIERFKLE